MTVQAETTFQEDFQAGASVVNTGIDTAGNIVDFVYDLATGNVGSKDPYNEGTAAEYKAPMKAQGIPGVVMLLPGSGLQRQVEFFGSVRVPLMTAIAVAGVIYWQYGARIKKALKRKKGNNKLLFIGLLAFLVMKASKR